MFYVTDGNDPVQASLKSDRNFPGGMTAGSLPRRCRQLGWIDERCHQCEHHALSQNSSCGPADYLDQHHDLGRDLHTLLRAYLLLGLSR
jgi:hypothetical protein